MVQSIPILIVPQIYQVEIVFIILSLPPSPPVFKCFFEASVKLDNYLFCFSAQISREVDRSSLFEHL